MSKPKLKLKSQGKDFRQFEISGKLINCNVVGREKYGDQFLLNWRVKTSCVELAVYTKNVGQLRKVILSLIESKAI